MENKNWVDIKGWEGFYQVNIFGQVLSLPRAIVRSNGSPQTFKSRIMAFGKDPDGYMRVKLFRPGFVETKKRHRLIAEAFLPNPYNKAFINHINGIKGDDRIENLQWCTASENNSHAYAIGLKSNSGANHSQAKKVIDNSTGKIFGCIKDAAISLNIKQDNFSRMLSGRVKNKTTFSYLKTENAN